jgi:hypothetical protein
VPAPCKKIGKFSSEIFLKIGSITGVSTNISPSTWG